MKTLIVVVIAIGAYCGTAYAQLEDFVTTPDRIRTICKFSILSALNSEIKNWESNKQEKQRKLDLLGKTRASQAILTQYQEEIKQIENQLAQLNTKFKAQIEDFRECAKKDTIKPAEIPLNSPEPKITDIDPPLRCAGLAKRDAQEFLAAIENHGINLVHKILSARLCHYQKQKDANNTIYTSEQLATLKLTPLKCNSVAAIIPCLPTVFDKLGKNCKTQSKAIIADNELPSCN